MGMSVGKSVMETTAREGSTPTVTTQQEIAETAPTILGIVWKTQIMITTGMRNLATIRGISI
jgi:hypothetical protein